jgi:hypothetical protein
MKFVEPNRFIDPDAAARKLVEIANAIEPARMAAFTSSRSKAASSKRAAHRTSSALASNGPSHPAGWGGTIGTYVKFTGAGAELFA